MASVKQKAAARRNVKKASAKWQKMSHAARKKAMPSRKYKVHTKKWDDMVKALRKEGKVKSPEAVATFKLGEKGWLKRKTKTKTKKRWIEVVKQVLRRPYTRKAHKRRGFVKDVKPGPGVKMKRIKATKVKKAKVPRGKMKVKGWKK